MISPNDSNHTARDNNQAAFPSEQSCLTLSCITLIHSAVLTPLVAIGASAAIRAYQPYLPEILNLSALSVAAISLAVQFLLAIFLLYRRPWVIGLVNAAAIANFLAATIAVGHLVLFSFSNNLLLVVISAVWPTCLKFLLARLNRKVFPQSVAADGEPTVNTTHSEESSQ